MFDANGLRSDAARLKPEAIRIRRDLHAHPELAFQEVRTSGVVAAFLEKLGLDVTTGVGKTGVLGLLRGPSHGPTALVRADMDALPIQEMNDVEYASVNSGVMHACGHDGHTTIGLMAAKLLTARRDQLRGSVKFAFQPAEETLGGAQAMIDDGALENPDVDVAFGLHLWSGSPLGSISTRAGALLAGADTLELRVEGPGGHAAMPHYTVDTILVASQIVTAIQTVVSRNISPMDAAVVSFGQIHGGSAVNVIPDAVTLGGAVRTFRADVRATVLQRIQEVAEGVAATHGAKALVRFKKVCDPTKNDDRATELVLDTARAMFGDDAILPTDGVMGSEDMSFFLDEKPGCFFFLGAEPTDKPAYPLHNPRFDFNEDALPLGAALLSACALRYLNGER